MTALLTTRQDKEQAIALLQSLLNHFIYHGVSPADRGGITLHLEWMHRQTADLKANCRLETFPATQTTRIVLDLSFAPEVKPFEQHQ